MTITKTTDIHDARRKHKHSFTARPADAQGRLSLDRSKDLKGRYTSYRNFIKFQVNQKGEQGQAYTVFEHCKTDILILIRRVEGVVPR